MPTDQLKLMAEQSLLMVQQAVQMELLTMTIPQH